MTDDSEELATRLRETAKIIPGELYSWLNPLLIEAADEIEHLTETLDRIESAAEDRRMW